LLGFDDSVLRRVSGKLVATMSLTERRRRLLDTGRWRALGPFVERWYAEPLCDADGYTRLEIEQVARRCGVRLPVALTEWYELVGKRLRDVQDSPTLLDEISIEHDEICIWSENQGVWSIVTRVDAGDDPLCRVDDKSFASPDAPLSQTLFGMLVSETIVGAWAGTRVGTLGELRASVRGGYQEDFNAETLECLASAYEQLDVTRNPFFDNKYRGDDTTVIRSQEVAIEWITATDEAFAALDDTLGLMPEGGEHEVVVAFEPGAVTPAQPLTHQLPAMATFSSLLAGVGHVTIAVMGGHGRGPRFHIRTAHPGRVLERLLAALPAELLSQLTVATRPVAISVFEVLYPEGKTTFVLPV
jgi:hypothetical protein